MKKKKKKKKKKMKRSHNTFATLSFPASLPQNPSPPPRTRSTRPLTMSSALCRAPLRPAPLARAAAASKAARAAAASKAAPAAAALAPARRSPSSPTCRATPSVDVGSDWPANWALASFEDVGEYYNAKLLKVRPSAPARSTGEEQLRSERGRTSFVSSAS
jgi:hypothetical protein